MAQTTVEKRAGSKKIATIFAVFAIFAVAFPLYSWWFSDERAIRNQLTTIATTLTVQPNEGPLEPVTRVATLRKLLAPDIRVTAGSQEVVSREAVLGLAARWVAPAGGLAVEFDDAQVKIADDRAGAEVYCTAKLTTRAAAGEPSVDAREVTIGFAKVDGTWVVSSARTESTLVR